MCGIAGFWQRGTRTEPLAPVASAMADRVAHRGPDDAGTWVDEAAGVALAHRRLAVLDLSAAGHQPMVSAGGRWVLVYNGELYNHPALRARLEAARAAPAWRGHSDTETLLAAIEAWGPDEALRRSRGMFALGLWDRRDRVLWLARDRAGEKPLYYGWQGDTFVFGSELKALRAHPAFRGEVDRGALALLLRHNCIPSPWSIYAGIRKLPAGTWLCLREGDRDAAPTPYWSLGEVAVRGTARPFAGDEGAALDALDRRLGDAVAAQMIADVPLGALLSGGIDSTLIVALMRARGGRRVHTFTVGFEERDYDEAAHARALAAHLGTEHTEVRLGARDALQRVPRLACVWDEPFADASQLPTLLVMDVARRDVTVALSGDGGDEFFGGYSRYFLAPRVWRWMSRLPAGLRAALGSGMSAVPAGWVNRCARLLPRGGGVALPGDKLHKLAQRMRGVHDVDDLYVALVSEWRDTHVVAGEAGGHPTLLSRRDAWPRLAEPEARMMALDALTYLPDDILVKVDRAAMAVSLETRAPFLDTDVMEFAWSLPLSMKLREGRGKWITRRLLDRYVPRALVDRPKMGFTVPLDGWLRGPLRDWAEGLLQADRLRREGFLDPAPIRALWRRHLRGTGAFGQRLWSVLMFEAWLDAGGARP